MGIQYSCDKSSHVISGVDDCDKCTLDKPQTVDSELNCRDGEKELELIPGLLQPASVLKSEDTELLEKHRDQLKEGQYTIQLDQIKQEVRLSKANQTVEMSSQSNRSTHIKEDNRNRTESKKPSKVEVTHQEVTGRMENESYCKENSVKTELKDENDCAANHLYEKGT